MPETAVRNYRTKHVYQTARGRWYDDRKGRIRERDAFKAIKNRDSMASKYRDEGGRVTLRAFSVTFTKRRKDNPKARTKDLLTPDVPELIGFDHDVTSDPAYLEKALHKADPDYIYFSVTAIESDEEMEEPEE